MRDFEEEFKKKGAHLAVVGLGDVSYARFFREKTGIRFPLLIDDKCVAYKTVGLRHASLLH
ncbi:MAG: AhpC/TSA family protein, partial [Candidatus Angelobacter sp.]